MIQYSLEQWINYAFETLTTEYKKIIEIGEINQEEMSEIKEELEKMKIAKKEIIEKIKQ